MYDYNSREMPAARDLQGDCEKVYWACLTIMMQVAIYRIANSNDGPHSDMNIKNM